MRYECVTCGTFVVCMRMWGVVDTRVLTVHVWCECGVCACVDRVYVWVICLLVCSVWCVCGVHVTCGGSTCGVNVECVSALCVWYTCSGYVLCASGCVRV
jgi:hypothetical protein